MADRLAPPPSAAALRGIAPEVHLLPAGVVLWRVYFRTGAHPGRWNGFRSFGPMGARFDHHPPPRRRNRTRAILYASDSGPTCLAEVFQDTRVIDRFADTPELVAFRITRDLQLLDLTGAWLTRAGASMAINSGSRALARRWSRAIYSAYPQVDGLRYASAMNANQPAFALYERARSLLPAAPATALRLTTPGLAAVLAAAATRFGYALL